MEVDGQNVADCTSMAWLPLIRKSCVVFIVGAVYMMMCTSGLSDDGAAGAGVPKREEVVAADSPASVAAAERLVKRVTPEYAGRVSFRIDASAAAPTIAPVGECGIRICAADTAECIRAYGYYLRELVNMHFSWNDDNSSAAKFVVPTGIVHVPPTLPFNYAFNYCALSYTGVHWSRERWLRELDRLALNGFRYVLVTSGLEKVWQGFLKDIGAGDKAADFIANPCYAAWWHMGNLYGVGGPVSQDLIESEAQLGRTLVARIRELGMQPVLQGYVGFVPPGYAGEGAADIVDQGTWVAGYRRIPVLLPYSPAFHHLASLWYSSIERVYGFRPCAFVGDLFHEGGRTDGIDVPRAIRAVQHEMQLFSPGSFWFLQAWGINPRSELLSATDEKYTIILALDKNLSPSGSMQRDYGGRRYVWCELANFGGNQGLYGGVELLEKSGEDFGGASGFGLLSEGLETNPLFYELFFERMNNRAPIDRSKFLKHYALARYGKCTPDIEQALNLLSESVYMPDGMREGCVENILCARPGLLTQKASTWSSPTLYYDPADVRRAATLLLEAGQSDAELAGRSAYRYDLTDVCRQVLADEARSILPRINQAYADHDQKAINSEQANFLNLLEMSADLLSTHPDFLLGVYLQGVRERTPAGAPKDELVSNLRRLITTWSAAASPLNDYAHRQFAEMMRSYYLPRWGAYFRSLNAEDAPCEGKEDREVVDNNGTPTVHISVENFAVDAIEKAFSTADIPLLQSPVGDTLEVAARILGIKPKK